MNKTMNTFAETGLNNKILKGLSSLELQIPTPVQAKVIPLILDKQTDLVCLAQTGTGKTAAFGLPLIQLSNVKKNNTQGLILCPTRELCVQVSRDLKSYSRYTDEIRIVALYGGSNIAQQIKDVRQGAHIIVATPGRLNDLLNRDVVDISSIKHVIFDEADEMLQMGFQDELNAILSRTPSDKNTLLFSATMSQEVTSMANRYMHNPIELTVGQRNAGAENVRHDYYVTPARNRYQTLKRIVDYYPDNYSIIFCRTRRECNEISGKLMHDGYSADCLHGELSQPQRDQVMNKFRCKNLQILVATDVAARGLDVNDLSHVINYNLPDDISIYTHRSGRTGRAGKKGTSIAIIQANHLFQIRKIENKLKKNFNPCRIPSGSAVCRKQIIHLADSIAQTDTSQQQIDSYYEELSKKFESYDRQELIKKFISAQLNHFMEGYKDAPDLNSASVSIRAKKPGKNDQRNGKSSHPTNSKGKLFRLFQLNAGRRQGIAPDSILGRINTIPGVSRIKVGEIKIMRNSTSVEIESKYTSKILQAFQETTINGKTVSIEVLQKNNSYKKSKQQRSIKSRNSSRSKKAA